MFLRSVPTEWVSLAACEWLSTIISGDISGGTKPILHFGQSVGGTGVILYGDPGATAKQDRDSTICGGRLAGLGLEFVVLNDNIAGGVYPDSILSQTILEYVTRNKDMAIMALADRLALWARCPAKSSVHNWSFGSTP